MKRTDQTRREISGGQTATVTRPQILLVGESSQLQTIAKLLQSSFPIVHADFDKVNTNFLASIAPDIVVTSLVSSDFDCLDLAHRLYDAGFLGRYRILTDMLPNPRVLINELFVSCPGLDADVLTTADMNTRLMN